MTQVIERSRFQFAFDGAIVLSLAAAWLYFCGSVHLAAYYRELGFAGHSPQFDPESTLTAGMSSLLIGGTPWLMRAILFFECILFVAVFGALATSIRGVDALLTSFLRVQEEIRTLPAGVGVERADRVLEFGRRLVPSAAVIIVMSALLLGSAILANNQGQASAAKLRNSFNREGAGLRTVIFANRRSVKLGPLVGCNSRFCLYMARDGVVAISRDLILAESISPKIR